MTGSSELGRYVLLLKADHALMGSDGLAVVPALCDAGGAPEVVLANSDLPGLGQKLHSAKDFTSSGMRHRAV